MNRGELGVIALCALFALAQAAFWGGMVYIAAHFLFKFW